MADALDVWMYGVRIATVEQERSRLRLSYTEEALATYALGTPLLALSLPLTADRYPNGVVRAFLDGLLPEGEARRAAAEDFDLRATDTFGLVGALGRECAGAVVIQPAALGPPPTPTIHTAERLRDDDIAELVLHLRSAPLGLTQRVRLSLAGVQEKLVLTRVADGSWGRPVDGTPSTHILKPEIAEYPSTVENEAFCMRLAFHLGLPVAKVETTTIAERRLLVVERYDRSVDGDGRVERIHQEDLCQALALPPAKKYEEDGGPSLRRIADIVQSAAGSGSVETLLQMVTLNVLVGNGDAHAKNFSLLHESSGGLGLAPLYDVLSTLWYGDDRLAMYVDDVRRTNRVTAERLVNEATSWGVPIPRASDVVADLVALIPVAVEAARDETPGLPDEILDVVHAQHARLAGSR